MAKAKKKAAAKRSSKKSSKKGTSTKGAVKLYTLSGVSQATGISMPTLQRYKKGYQDRIPSVGEGRTQRYPEEALEVFQQIKTENMARRGRPRKSTAAKATSRAKTTGKGRSRKAPAKTKPKKQPTAAPDSGLLSLAEIERRTGISYPTLMRYVKINLAAIPHVGEGRKRRYRPDAVEVFREMRAQSRRGGRKLAAAGERAASAARDAVDSAVRKTAAIPADLSQRIRELEATQKRMGKQIEELLSELRKPIEVTFKRR